MHKMYTSKMYAWKLCSCQFAHTDPYLILLISPLQAKNWWRCVFKTQHKPKLVIIKDEARNILLTATVLKLKTSVFGPIHIICLGLTCKEHTWVTQKSVIQGLKQRSCPVIPYTILSSWKCDPCTFTGIGKVTGAIQIYR